MTRRSSTPTPTSGHAGAVGTKTPDVETHPSLTVPTAPQKWRNHPCPECKGEVTPETRCWITQKHGARPVFCSIRCLVTYATRNWL